MENVYCNKTYVKERIYFTSSPSYVMYYIQKVSIHCLYEPNPFFLCKTLYFLYIFYPFVIIILYTLLTHNRFVGSCVYTSASRRHIHIGAYC